MRGSERVSFRFGNKAEWWTEENLSLLPAYVNITNFHIRHLKRNVCCRICVYLFTAIVK